MSDPDHESATKSWAIDGIAPEIRNAAIGAAAEEHQAIGEWLSRAIRSQAQADHRSNRTPGPSADPATDLAEAERIVGMIGQLSAAGVEVPASVGRSAYALLETRLRQMRRTLSQPSQSGPSSKNPVKDLKQEEEMVNTLVRILKENLDNGNEEATSAQPRPPENSTPTL